MKFRKLIKVFVLFLRNFELEKILLQIGQIGKIFIRLEKNLWAGGHILGILKLWRFWFLNKKLSKKCCFFYIGLYKMFIIKCCLIKIIF